ncbi:MAG: response regulator [Deltaproteobacteria bacterium]|nr:response regulator [Deltaproteobacteria bacterium]
MTMVEALVAHPLRVLVVDDEAVLRRLVRSLLERDGHRVQTASSGDEALLLFASARAIGEPFDVVVTDLTMPGTDGEGVANEVKRAAPSTAVILLTGFGFGMSGQSFDRILGKPEGLRVLRATVLELGRAATSRSWDPAEGLDLPASRPA